MKQYTCLKFFYNIGWKGEEKEWGRWRERWREWDMMMEEISLKIGREDDGLGGGKEEDKIFLGIRDSTILLMCFLLT